MGRPVRRTIIVRSNRTRYIRNHNNQLAGIMIIVGPVRYIRIRNRNAGGTIIVGTGQTGGTIIVQKANLYHRREVIQLNLVVEILLRGRKILILIWDQSGRNGGTSCRTQRRLILRRKRKSLLLIKEKRARMIANET